MDGLLAIDYGLMYFAGSRQHPSLTPVMIGLTRLGDGLVLVAVAVAACAALFSFRRPAEARGLAGAGLLALALVFGIKALAGRDRPDVVWREVNLPPSSSFPSGHALGALAVYGSLALFLSRGVKPAGVRWLVQGLGFGLAAAVGISRVYLGVHYPLDVLAGWAGGTVAVLFAVGLSGEGGSTGTGQPPDSTAVVVRPGRPGS